MVLYSSQPKISVIMPVFNAANHLMCSIKSVIEQTFINFELIIINDGSTDSSLRQINEWQRSDKRIRVINQPKNLGISSSRNIGISEANSNLLAFIDADDTWLPNKLEIQLNYHFQTNCAFSCTAFWMSNKAIRAKNIIHYSDLLANNVINTSSVMVDREQIELTFSIMEKSEDYHQWLIIARQHDIHFIDQLLVNRSVLDGISSNKASMAMQRWRIYREGEKLSLFSSSYYFVCYALSGIRKYWRLRR